MSHKIDSQMRSLALSGSTRARVDRERRQENCYHSVLRRKFKLMKISLNLKTALTCTVYHMNIYKLNINIDGKLTHVAVLLCIYFTCDIKTVIYIFSTNNCSQREILIFLPLILAKKKSKNLTLQF